MNGKYEIIQINEDTWRVEDSGVRFFVLKGTQKALLIDSGMTVTNAKEIAEELTGLPAKLLNTHADMDHIASNFRFEAPYMNPAELSNYHNTQGRNGEITPVGDGNIIELGERKLEIITLPGHTPGSIAVLDCKYEALFSGDPIQDGRIFMFGVQRDMCAYRHSLLKLQKMKNRFSVIYPSHGTFSVEPELIDELIKVSEDILDEKLTPQKGEFMGTPLCIYETDAATFLCNAK